MPAKPGSSADSGIESEPEIEIEVDESAKRLDAYLAALPSLGFSRSQLKRLIDEGAVLVNGQKSRPRDAVYPGGVITIRHKPRPLPPLAPVDLHLDVIFEDADLLVINKPAGLVVHPGAGDTGPTLVHGLLFHCLHRGGLSQEDGARPGIVHRLDKDTSGLLVCAKTDETHRHLAHQFHEKTNRREYVALMDGKLALREKRLVTWIARDRRDRRRMVSLPENRQPQVDGPDIGDIGAGKWRRAESFFSRK